MKKKTLVLINTLLVTALIGCGSSSSSAPSFKNDAMEATAAAEAPYYEEDYEERDYSYDDYAYEEEMVTESATAGTSAESVSVTEGDTEATSKQNTERMLIKNVNMSVESEDIDLMIKNVEKRVDDLGGYIESMNVSTQNSGYSNSQRKTADIVARIPVGKLDLFVNEVEGQSNVLNKHSDAEDVTLKYVDMQSRMDSLQTEYDRIYELLEKADNLDNIIALEQRLTDIRYELQSYGSQIKAMKNLASYSTVNLNITQVIEYTPIVEEEKTRFERMTEGFVSNCKIVWNGILDFFVDLVVALPIILIWLVVIAVIILILRLIGKGYRKKHPKKEKVKKVKEAAPGTFVARPQSTVKDDTGEKQDEGGKQ